MLHLYRLYRFVYLVAAETRAVRGESHYETHHVSTSTSPAGHRHLYWEDLR